MLQRSDWGRFGDNAVQCRIKQGFDLCGAERHCFVLGDSDAMQVRVTRSEVSGLIEVKCTSDVESRKAFARRLGDDIAGASIADANASVVVRVTDDRVELVSEDRGFGSVYADFVEGRMGFRTREQVLRRELVVRAVGYKGQPLRVHDATAGLGRDAVVLALVGCEVTATERHPVLHALLRDGLDRASVADPAMAEVLRDRLSLHRRDAIEFLTQLSQGHRPDVVYLDPMFPERRKSALVKKEMRVFRIFATDEGGADLFDAAMQSARSRVVVKRPLKAPNLVPDAVPVAVMKGKAVRFDVYAAHTR